MSLMDPQYLWWFVLAIVSFYVSVSMFFVVFAIGGLWETILFATETNTQFWIDLFFNSKLYKFIQGFGTW